MKKLAVVLLCLVFLSGCSGENKAMEQGMWLRTELLKRGCSFDARITADYGDALYTFAVSCTGTTEGALSFTVTAPDTISGIAGQISKGEGKLTFADTALSFPLLADGQVTPVSAPWLLLKTLQGGYLTAAGMDGEQIRLTVHDSYAEDALQLDIWLDGDALPVRAEILFAGRRILTLEIANFQLL